MKKEDILSKITDADQKESVKTFLEFAEAQAKAAEMTAEKFKQMFDEKAAELKIEVKTVEGLQTQLDALGTSISAMKEEGTKAEVKSIYTQVKESMQENIEKLKALKKGERVQFDFTLKSGPATMLESTNLAAGIPLEQRLPNLNIVPQRNPFIAQLIQAGTAASNIISWVYEVVGAGGAGGTAEGVKKNQIDASFAVGKEDIKKRTVFVKVSEEMLDDVDFMASYITNVLLNQKLTLDVDNQILNGNNISTNFNGIVAQAESFAAGSFAGTITDPNLKDVVAVAVDQIAVQNFQANAVVLHPSDLTAFSLIKNKDGNYLYPELREAERSLGGLPVYTNTGVAKGYFLVMDGTKAAYYSKGGIVIKTGWENDDFTLNLRTILAETRGCVVIETNNTKAFVYDQISTAKAAIEATT